MSDIQLDQRYLINETKEKTQLETGTQVIVNFLHGLCNVPVDNQQSTTVSFQNQLRTALNNNQPLDEQIVQVKGIMVDAQDIVIGQEGKYFRGGLIEQVMRDSLLDNQRLAEGLAIFLLMHKISRKRERSMELENDRAKFLETSVIAQQLISKFMLNNTPDEVARFVKETQIMNHFLGDTFGTGKGLDIDVDSIIRGSIGTLAAACFSSGVTGENARFPTPIWDQLYGIDFYSETAVGQSKVRKIDGTKSDQVNLFSIPDPAKNNQGLYRHKGPKDKKVLFFDIPASVVKNSEYEMIFRGIRCVPVKDENGNIYRARVEVLEYDSSTGTFNAKLQPAMLLEHVIFEVLSMLPQPELLGFDIQNIRENSVTEDDKIGIRSPFFTKAIREAINQTRGYPVVVKELVKDILLALGAAEIDPDLRKNTTQILHIESDLHRISNGQRPEDLAEYARGSMQLIQQMMQQFNIDSRFIQGI